MNGDSSAKLWKTGKKNISIIFILVAVFREQLFIAIHFTVKIPNT